MTVYDIAILGSGPIGASSAYFLSKAPNRSIVVVTQDPCEERSATYRWAGGSIRLYWDDPVKLDAVQQTAAFVRDAAANGVDLDLIEDSYLFLNRGHTAPSINASGVKLVRHLLDEAAANGVELREQVTIEGIAAEDDGYRIETSAGPIEARKVILALGTENPKFAPHVEIEREKRQLFVLDLPIDEHREGFPHLVLPFKGGVVFVFLKKINGELKMVLGQEDVVEHTETEAADDYYDLMLSMGLPDVLPFLDGVGVENILWGWDAPNKLPNIITEDDKLFVVNCGSAVRSAIMIGKTVADRVS